jgi:hypothetical protein
MSARRPTLCDYCSEPLPAYEGGPGRPRRFCDEGCAAAYRMGRDPTEIDRLNAALAADDEEEAF